MKYLEEYSVRTEEDDDENGTAKISPRSDLTSYNNSVRSKADSNYGVDSWSTDIDQSNNNDVMDGSLPMSAAKRNGKWSESNGGHGVSEMVTNIDDVKL